MERFNLSKNLIKKKLPKRPKDANKGTFGKVLIVGGSENYPGAPHLAALAAARVGAGLITVATTASARIFIAQKNLEFTYLPLSASVITSKLSEYDASLIGPGLGLANQNLVILKQLIDFYSKKDKLPNLVIDADGLNLLSQIDNWWVKLKGEVILTPHPGEMAYLVGMKVEEVQKSREKLAKEFSKKLNKIIVLKGANTVIATPNGEEFVSNFATPALSSAGTGDILSGMIAGFLAQGLGPRDAALVGVYIHGMVGQILEKRLGDAGGIASDLLQILPIAIQKLKQ